MRTTLHGRVETGSRSWSTNKLQLIGGDLFKVGPDFRAQERDGQGGAGVQVLHRYPGTLGHQG